MKPFMLTGLILLVFMILGPTGAMPMDLSQFQWKHRLLLLFAPDAGHPDFSEIQRQLKAQRAGVADRDLRVFAIVDGGSSRLDGAPLEREAVDAIRKRFDAPRDRFTLILIGKDGTIKLRRNDRTDLDDIFALIDAMPMRQNEMRRKNRQP